MQLSTAATKRDVSIEIKYHLPDLFEDIRGSLFNTIVDGTTTEFGEEKLSQLQTIVEENEYTATVSITYPSDEYDSVSLFDEKRLDFMGEYTENGAGEENAFSTKHYSVGIQGGDGGTGSTIRLDNDGEIIMQTGVRFPPVSVLAMSYVIGEDLTAHGYEEAVNRLFPADNPLFLAFHRMAAYFPLVATPEQYRLFRKLTGELTPKTVQWSPSPEEYITRQFFTTDGYSSPYGSALDVRDEINEWVYTDGLPDTSLEKVTRHVFDELFFGSQVNEEVLEHELFTVLKQNSAGASEHTWHDVFSPETELFWVYAALLYATGRENDAIEALGNAPIYVTEDNIQRQITHAESVPNEKQVSEWGRLLPVLSQQSHDKLPLAIGKVLYGAGGDLVHGHSFYEQGMNMYECAGEFLDSEGLDVFGTNAKARAKYVQGNNYLHQNERKKAIGAYEEAIEHAVFAHNDQSDVDYYAGPRAIEYLLITVTAAVQRGTYDVSDGLATVSDINERIAKEPTAVYDGIFSQGDRLEKYMSGTMSELMGHKLLEANESETSPLDPSEEQINTQFTEALELYDESGLDTAYKHLQEFMDNNISVSERQEKESIEAN